MSIFVRIVGAVVGIICFAVVLEPAHGQGQGIGARGGQATVPVPQLPRVREATSSLIDGLNQAGSAIRSALELRPNREQGPMPNAAPQPQQPQPGLFPRIQRRIEIIDNGGPVFPRLNNGLPSGGKQ